LPEDSQPLLPGDLALSNGDHPECYGTIFPSLLHLPEDRPASGTVFTVALENAGGMWRSSRSVRADMERWDQCRQCGDFEGCYKFSMAKLAMESAIQNR
jgi:hypothetical protein